MTQIDALSAASSTEKMNRVTGSCHCGNLRFEASFSEATESLPPRACDCEFCRKHGASYLSDPKGSLNFSAKDRTLVMTYKQGSGTADFLVCAKCGVLAGVTYTTDGKTFGAINRATVDGDVAFADPKTVSPKTLATDVKTRRWQDVWFPNVKWI